MSALPEGPPAQPSDGATSPAAGEGAAAASGGTAARLRELELVHELSTAVARAETLEAIYEITLDAVIEVMHADRASLLLFDEAGVLRFRAWRGLSAEYRQAVEGHTPWTPEQVDAAAIAVENACEDESLAPFREVFEREGIGALAFVPLASERRLLGKFMVYRNQPHAWDGNELRLAHTLGNHVALAVERTWREEALREHAERLAESDLPLAASEEEGVAPEAPAATASPAGLEVLVVDDNRDAADSLSLLLEIKGCRVATAYDGAEALAAAARRRPAAVVLDIAMPGMNGYEVAERMRGEPELAAARLIALTGFGHDEARRRVREAGIDHHLVKPVDLDHLLRLLGEVANGAGEGGTGAGRAAAGGAGAGGAAAGGAAAQGRR